MGRREPREYAPVRLPLRKDDYVVDGASPWNDRSADKHGLIAMYDYRPSYEGADLVFLREQLIKEAEEINYPGNALPDELQRVPPLYRRRNRRDGINLPIDCLACFGEGHYLGDCDLFPLAEDLVQLWIARDACLKCRGIHPGEGCNDWSKRTPCTLAICKNQGIAEHCEDFCTHKKRNVQRRRHLRRD